MSLAVNRFLPSSTSFLSHCTYRVFQPGDVIVDVDQSCESLFYILCGNVTISMPNKNLKKEAINLASLHNGDFFGELGLLTEQKRSAKVLATMPTAIAEIEYSKFKELTESDNQMLFALSTQLADKLWATSRKLSEFMLLERQARKACSEHEEVKKQLLLDPLTEIANRQAYIWHCEKEFVRWQRYQRPLTMAVCDIDFFKKINDRHGHLAGDSVLQVVAKILKNRLRSCDFIARYGGEEFVILMPETTGHGAMKALDSMRLLVEKCPLSYSGESVSLTISCGITEFISDDSSPEDIFKRADAALYEAKNTGRNKIVLF